MDKTKTVKTRKTPTPAFAVISFLVIVAVLGVTLLGEKLDIRQWAGISLITVGVVLLAWRR